jgi:hypothetical protein
MHKGKPHDQERQASCTEVLESFGVDDYILEYRDEAVQDDAAPLIEEFISNSGDCDGKTESVRLTQHRRNYGSRTCYTLEFVVSIPRPDSAVVIHKGHGNTRRVIPQDIDFEVAEQQSG